MHAYDCDESCLPHDEAKRLVFAHISCNENLGQQQVARGRSSAGPFDDLLC